MRTNQGQIVHLQEGYASSQLVIGSIQARSWHRKARFGRNLIDCSLCVANAKGLGDEQMQIVIFR